MGEPQGRSAPAPVDPGYLSHPLLTVAAMISTRDSRPVGDRQAADSRLPGDACLAELRARLARRCEVEAAGDSAFGGDIVGHRTSGDVAADESVAGEGARKSTSSSGSGVRSAADQMRVVVGPLLEGPLVVGESARAADDADLVWCAQAVQRAINVLEGARSVLTAEAVRRRLHARRGEASSAEMLANATAVGGAVARRVEREAQALDAQPQVAEALGRGEINAEQAAAVATADVPDDVRAELCGQAGSQTADQTRQAVRAAEAALRVESDAQRRARQRAARSASMWTDRHDGMWYVRAKFDAATGDEINRRLVCTIQQHWRSDKDLPESQRRSVPQRAADALAWLLTGSAAVDDGPNEVGWAASNRSQMIVVTTLDNLWGGSPGGRPDGACTCVASGPDHDVLAVPGEGCTAADPASPMSGAARRLLAVSDAAAVTETGTVLGAAELRRIACDTSVIPVVMGGAGEVLDVGRAARTIPPSIRRALIARDQGCVWPGCDRAPIHCDGHHIEHWVDDGPTCVANLALLCHSHHQRLHEYNLVLHPPTGPAPPGQGWTVTPAPPHSAPASAPPCEGRTPVRDHVRQNC